jgi:hypothetical protein
MAHTVECTLADLLESMQDVTEDDHAVVAAATRLINSGQVRLRGKLAGAKVKLSPSFSTLPKFLWPSLLGLSDSSLGLSDSSGRNNQSTRKTKLAA